MECVFFGTPEFARLVLERLAARHCIPLAVTQPGRPAGRGRTVQASPVMEHCRATGIPCLAPADAREEGLAARMAASGAEVGVVVAYGGYLPRALLASLPRGFINLHPSLLPRWRGAAPVNRAIMAGEAVTGVSIIRVTPRMDAGPILHQEELPIIPGETAGELLLRLAAPGAEALARVLDGLERGEVPAREQDESRATLAPRMRKEDGRIDWKDPAGKIADLVRGTSPWPGAYSRFGNSLVKVLRAEALPGPGAADPGTILRAGPEELLVAAGEGSLRLLVLQREGGKPLPAAEFLRGVRWRTGEVLGP